MHRKIIFGRNIAIATQVAIIFPTLHGTVVTEAKQLGQLGKKQSLIDNEDDRIR